MPQELGRRSVESKGISEVTMAHLYRAEVSRSTDWRTRLDTTTNWAITVTAAVISFAFASPQAPHAVLLVGAFLVFTFLVLEARRYRYYDLWARRVRLLESGYLAPLLRREPVTADFAAALASEFTRPRLRIGSLDALLFRLRRTYAPILGLVLAAWVVKLDLHPTTATSFAEVVERARIGPVHGAVVCAVWVVATLAFAALLAMGSRRPLPSTELHMPTRKRQLGHAFGRVGPRGQVRLHEVMDVERASSSDQAG